MNGLKIKVEVEGLKRESSETLHKKCPSCSAPISYSLEIKDGIEYGTNILCGKCGIRLCVNRKEIFPTVLP